MGKGSDGGGVGIGLRFSEGGVREAVDGMVGTVDMLLGALLMSDLAGEGALGMRMLAQSRVRLVMV